MARKKSLREYQVAVAERLKTIALRGTAAASKLGFFVGEQRWILNLNEVAEVLPVPSIVSIPLTKSYFIGTCNVRGNLYGVVDFSAFMENLPIVPSVENRLLLLPGTFVQGAAILVSRMAGLRSPDAFTLMERKADFAPWIANMYQDAEGQVWNEVDVAALSQHENFLNVGR